jgi:uncharacterized protein
VPGEASEEMTMAIFFDIKRNDNQEFFFHLTSDQGELLLMSGEYPSREALDACIKEVKVGSLMGHQIAAGKVGSGETFFVIKDSNGQIIAKSALYANQMLFDNALHLVKDNSCIAESRDLSAA